MKTIQIIIAGRVQGVCFRASTQKQAIKLGVTGFVKNNADGSVKVVASAETEILEKLIAWCRIGPIMAKVTDLTVEELTTTEKLLQFDIL
jgi:acylphosphatase